MRDIMRDTHYAAFMREAFMRDTHTLGAPQWVGQPGKPQKRRQRALALDLHSNLGFHHLDFDPIGVKEVEPATGIVVHLCVGFDLEAGQPLSHGL